MARHKQFTSPVLPREDGGLDDGPDESPPVHSTHRPVHTSPRSPHTSPHQPSSRSDSFLQQKHSSSRTACQSSGDTLPVSSSQLRAAFRGSYSNMEAITPPTGPSLPERAVSTTPSSPTVPVTSVHAKMMIKCARNLRSIGINNAVPELPSICVVGDQSVGKSSLIEAISGITVPRSSGTCTRCPLEINLINETRGKAEWRCEIYLVKNYYYDGSKTNATKDRPYGPWLPQTTESHHFASTRSKSDLREMIARAQLAILNPGGNPTHYLHQTFDRSHQVKFSPNVIRLNIFSPEVSDLSLFDLPGVITVPETDEERYLVGIVEKLVKNYISSDQTIILLALPMTNDATNSKAVNIVQRSGAKSRTIGVLTKPDLFQPSESFEQWLDILLGKKFALGHGYFVVCNAADVSIGHTEARAAERYFFSDSGWSDPPLSGLSHRFGTDNLSKQLQRLLEEQIQDGLPSIHESIDSRIAQVTEDLAKLPQPRETPAILTISQSLNSCNRGLESLFSTSSRPGESFRRDWNQLAKRFRSVLANTRPRMRRRSRLEERKVQKMSQGQQPPNERENVESQIINVDSEPEDCPATPSGGEKRKRQHNPWDDFSGVEYHLDDIRVVINDYASNIPNLLNPRAIDIMNQTSVQHWSGPLSFFLQQVQRLASIHIKDVVIQAFDPQKQKGRLLEEVMLRVDEFISNTMAAQVAKAEEMLSVEIHCPYTLNEHAMKLEKISAWELLNRSRADIRLLDAGHNLTPRKSQQRSNANELLGPDEWAREVEMFATVRAYYSIAFSRFTDNILQTIQCHLFTNLRTGLFSHLESYFNLTTKAGEELCEELLADDPDVVNARRELREEIGRLDNARAEIERVFAAAPRSRERGRLNEDEGEEIERNGEKSSTTIENDMEMHVG